MAGNDVAIPIVFPDYLITVEAPSVTLDVPDWLPGVPNEVKLGGGKTKLPYLGHAGILFYTGHSGLTMYYEYGRYDPAAFGLVRRQAIPDVTISGAKATAKSLTVTLAAVSKQSGQSGAISGVYIELEPGAFEKMHAYATLRLRANSNSKRPKYDLTENSCMHFMRSVSVSGGAPMPEVFDPRPTGYMEKARNIFPDLDFTPPSSLKIEGVTLP